MQIEEGTTPDQQRFTFSGKQLEDERMISDYNVNHQPTWYASVKLKGGAAMTAEEITNAFNILSAQPQKCRRRLQPKR